MPRTGIRSLANFPQVGNRKVVRSAPLVEFGMAALKGSSRPECRGDGGEACRQDCHQFFTDMDISDGAIKSCCGCCPVKIALFGRYRIIVIAGVPP